MHGLREAFNSHLHDALCIKALKACPEEEEEAAGEEIKTEL